MTFEFLGACVLTQELDKIMEIIILQGEEFNFKAPLINHLNENLIKWLQRVVCNSGAFQPL